MTLRQVAESVFWISLFGACYSYFFYPAILLVLSFCRRQESARDLEDGELPSLSVIIAAYNEESQIAPKLENVLESDYPRSKLEIIVVSDGSTDATEAIVRQYEDRGVRLLRTPGHQGKEYAQGLGISKATGDVVVLSDVAARWNRDSLRKLVRKYCDPSVGAVTCSDIVIPTQNGESGEGVYVRYENWMRRLESKLGTTMVMTGAFCSVRRGLYHPWKPGLTSDLSCAFDCLRQGYRVLIEPASNCYYLDTNSPEREYKRKVRTVNRGMAAVLAYRDLLNPFRYPLVAFELWSHKIARWAVPWFLILLLISSLVLAPASYFYTFVLVSQIGFYAAAVAGLLFPVLRRFVLFRIPAFFVLSNVAILHATILFLLGKRIAAWTPTKRD